MKCVKKLGDLSKGQSLFEVLFAIAIAAIILVGVVSLSSSGVRNSAFSRNKTLATRFAQETTEWIRRERDFTNDWTAFSAHAGTHCFSSTPISSWAPGGCGSNISGTIFEREAVLTVSTTTVAGDTMDIFVTVSWEDAQGTHEVKTVTSLTNWRNE